MHIDILTDTHVHNCIEIHIYWLHVYLNTCRCDMVYVCEYEYVYRLHRLYMCTSIHEYVTLCTCVYVNIYTLHRLYICTSIHVYAKLCTCVYVNIYRDYIDYICVPQYMYMWNCDMHARCESGLLMHMSMLTYTHIHNFTYTYIEVLIYRL